MKNMGGGPTVTPGGGYSMGWGGGYGPGAGPQSGGNLGSGSRTPGMGNWVYDPDDPFGRTGFAGAETRFQPGHRFSSIDPNFYYGRADWQETQKSPEYKQWLQQAKQKQLFLLLMKRLGIGGGIGSNPFAHPPSVDTPWDDARNSLGNGFGGFPRYWSGMPTSPQPSNIANYW